MIISGRRQPRRSVLGGVPEPLRELAVFLGLRRQQRLRKHGAPSGFWYKLLDLNIPRGATMNGGNYLSPDMEMPDTIDVSMDQPENLLFTWNSGFGNRHYNAEDDLLLGTKGTLIRSRYRAEYIPEGQHPRRSGGASAALLTGLRGCNKARAHRDFTRAAIHSLHNLDERNRNSSAGLAQVGSLHERQGLQRLGGVYGPDMALEELCNFGQQRAIGLGFLFRV
jgi:hypothetical protein